MRPTLAWMCSAVVLGAACGGGSSSDSASTTTVPRVSTTVAATTTSIETTTTTTEPSGLLPVPEDLPLPPVASLADVQVTLTPLLDIPHLLGMAWSQMAGYFYLITQDGQVFRTPPDFSSSEMVLDLTDEVSAFIYGSERGLLGVAVNPLDGRLFLNFTDRENDSHIVSFAVVDGRPEVTTRREVIFIEQPGLSHKAGMLVFDDQGHLYASFGDGGGNAGRTSQDFQSLLGSILRIVPNADSDGYTVPPDNPFVGEPDKRPELFAKGLRQPHRFSLNRANGEIYIGDVGENVMEELNRIPPGTSGQNFGWYFYEGFGRRSPGGQGLEFTEPLYQFEHPSWIAIIAGYVYHGTKIPALRGALVLGDMTGPIYAMGSDGLQRLIISEKGNVLTSFAEGPDGELYTMSLDGGLKRIDPA
ncbi:MAG: PQQ-dependent sugar dehydrogenase [Actinomycetota bacterium]